MDSWDLDLAAGSDFFAELSAGFVSDFPVSVFAASALVVAGLALSAFGRASFTFLAAFASLILLPFTQLDFDQPASGGGDLI